jgi:hypothetical protein
MIDRESMRRQRRTFGIGSAAVLVWAMSACSGATEPAQDGGMQPSERDGSSEWSDAAEPRDEDAASVEGFDAAASMELDPIDTLTLDPPSATLRVSGGAPATIQFKALGSVSSGAAHAVAATFELDSSAPGSIDANTGLFTSNNLVGGVVTVTASYRGRQASASLR